MNKAILSCAFLIILLASLGQVPFTFSSATQTKTIATFGAIQSIAMPTKKLVVAYGVDSPLPQDIIVHLAKFDMVDTSFEIGPDIEKIKALNPAVKVIGYKDLIAMSTGMDDWAEVNAHEDWFMHDVNGNRLQVPPPYSWYLMDISKQGWREHYANYVKQRLDAYGFDGVFADDVWTHLFRDGFTVNSSLVPDWNYMVNQYTYWQTQMRGFLSYVKSGIGNKLLISNSPSSIYIDVTDGKMLEGFGLHDVEWWTPLDDIKDLAEISALGKYYMASPYGGVDDTEEKFLYSFCCFLLGVNGPNAYFSWKGIWAGSQGYYPEMDFDFGNPIGSYYLVKGALYCRDFVHAKVLVNLSKTETYTLEIRGNSYTLNPKSGLIVSS